MITQIFGKNCKRVEVIDVLLAHPQREFTKSDISKIANIHRTTLNTFIDELIGIDLIGITRSLGNTKLYSINLNSPITHALNSFQNQLKDIEIEKQEDIYDESNINKSDMELSFKEVPQKDCFDKIVSNPTNTRSVFRVFNQTSDKNGTLTNIQDIAGIAGHSGVNTYKNNASQSHKVVNTLSIKIEE